MQQKINIIAAFSKNRVIGFRGKIPWKLPEDMRRFKELTSGNTVIMGRKTFQEIGSPLPERFNIVISRSEKFSGDMLVTAVSLEDALRISNEKGFGEIFLCGGESVYREGLAFADRLYLTEIGIETVGDAFFPEIGENFRCISVSEVNGTIFHRNKIYVRRED